MAKRNRSRIKKRRKRQLEKRIQAVAKVATAELPMTAGEIYQKELDGIYNGSIRPLHRFHNYKSTLAHRCDNCRKNFFARPSLLIGGIYPHVCYMDYKGGKDRKIPKSSGKDLTWEQFYELVIEEYTYKGIAQKLQVNPEIIKLYFEREGLI